jgi:hypothetical protein
MREEDDLWPVVPSEIVADTLADPSVSAEVFSTVAALTVAICDPCLAAAQMAVAGGGLCIACPGGLAAMPGS